MDLFTVVLFNSPFDFLVNSIFFFCKSFFFFYLPIECYLIFSFFFVFSFSWKSFSFKSFFGHVIRVAVAAMQRQPSNIIIFGLSLWLLQSSQPHPSNTIEFVCGVPGVFVGWVGYLCGLGWVSLLGYVMG